MTFLVVGFNLRIKQHKASFGQNEQEKKPCQAELMS